MKVLKSFNNISESLKASIPVLKPGEIRTVRMLTGTAMLQVNDDGSQYWEEVFGKHQIPTRDRIKDPFYKAGSGSLQYVDIGVPDQFNADTEAVITTRFLMPGMGEDQFLGKFSLVGGNTDDEELFEYLWISNLNASNPHRDKNVIPLYEFIDVVKESKEKRKKVNSKLEALSIATTMNIDDVKDLHSAMGWPVVEDHEILRASVENYAEEFPDEFLSRYTDPATKVRSEIQRAIEGGFIKYDHAEHKLLWAKSDAVVVRLERIEGKNYLDQAAEWMVSSGDQGTKFRKSIQKFLRERILKANTPEELVETE